MKPKVYFGKSNLCDPQRVAEIRKSLQDLDIELVEFQGGEYNNKELLKCDYLILCTYEKDTDGVCCSIGRGLYQQIDDFTNKHSADKVYIILPGENHKIVLTGINEIDVTECDWKRNYADIEFNLESIWITSLFNFKEKSNLSITIKSNKYLLISK